MNTCRWCGRQFSGNGYGGDGLFYRFCGERCAREFDYEKTRNAREFEMGQLNSQRDAQIREEIDELNSAIYEVRRIEEERLEIEREKIRKADPKQWYGSEWVEHLLEYPEDAEKCNKWNEIDAEHWIMLLKSRKEYATNSKAKTRQNLFQSVRLINWLMFCLLTFPLRNCANSRGLTRNRFRVW